MAQSCQPRDRPRSIESAEMLVRRFEVDSLRDDVAATQGIGPRNATASHADEYRVFCVPMSKVVGSAPNSLEAFCPMHPRIHAKFHEIIKTHGPRDGRVLEIGGLPGPHSLLRFPELENAKKILVNLSAKKEVNGIETVQGNSNDMAFFETGTFDLVVSNAVLEHDKYFWKSILEMKRVLKPGGLMVIGVPGYAELPSDTGCETKTFKVHFVVDYYRFSPQAVRDVFFEGMSEVHCETMLSPPRIIGWGQKPADHSVMRRLLQRLQKVDNS